MGFPLFIFEGDNKEILTDMRKRVEEGIERF